MPSQVMRGGLILVALLTAACFGCASVPDTNHTAARLERWRVDDGPWFVTVEPVHKATLLDATRIIVALRKGLYEDHTGDPLSSRKVIDSLASGQMVSFATYSDTEHSLAWSSATHNALVSISLSGDVLRLHTAVYYID